MKEGWRPEREVELVAGTPPGGGQDRPARALIEVLTANRLLDVPVRLTNVPGRGGGNAWDYLASKAGDAHVLAINSPTIISNKLLGVSAFDYDALTPIANLYTECPAFLVRAVSSMADLSDLSTRLGKNAASVSISLATALGNTNHIALSTLTRHAGGDAQKLKIAVFDSARDAIAHLVCGRSELAVVTAVSAVPELEAGTLRTLAISAPNRLDRLFAETPTLQERRIDCDIGMWRGLIAPAGVPAEAVAFWERTLALATGSPPWQAELSKKYWANTYCIGPKLRKFLDQEREVTSKALLELGLTATAVTAA
jgi:putative tricarboxylic transport membrane protein